MTPAAVAIYPWLNKADTKFKAHGEYRVKFRFDPEEVQHLADAAHDAAEAKLAEMMADKDVKPAVKKVLKLADNPFKAEVDEDTGDETGKLVANFKSAAKWEDKKTGELKERKLAIFDASGKPCSANIWGGSTLKVSFEIIPYYTPKDKVVGSSLRMKAVQVLELASGSGGNAASYGFAAEEGYVSQDTEEPKEEAKQADGEAEVDLDFC